MYLALAQRHMQNWGSSVFASRLEVLLAPIRPYLSLISQDISPEAPQRPANDSTSREVTERLFDVATVLKAAQAIASEIEMDRLLEQVMGIVLPTLEHSAAFWFFRKSKRNRRAERLSTRDQTCHRCDCGDRTRCCAGWFVNSAGTERT